MGEQGAILAAAREYGEACKARNARHAERDAIAAAVKARGENIAAGVIHRHPLYHAVRASNDAEARCAACLRALEAALGVATSKAT